MIAGVAAGHPATAEAGVEILRDGGSAADAAVAASLASCVAETVMTGLLGGGHAIHWDAATRTAEVGRLPESSDRDADGATSTCGKRPALVPRTIARACANCAAAARSVWFEISICRSSALSAGSPNSSHQSPRSS